MNEWWKIGQSRAEPDRYPVDVGCPVCGKVLLGWATYRIVVVRKDAHCRHCNADIAVQTSEQSPRPEWMGSTDVPDHPDVR